MQSSKKKPSRTKNSLPSPSKRGLTGIEDIDPRITIVKETASVIPFIIKTAIVYGIGYYIYYSYTNRFTKLKENGNYPNANVSLAQAKNRADGIASAKSLFDQLEFGSQYQTTSQQLSGLNYNGFIRVYNSFGHQSGHFLGGDMNLIEFLKDQFSDYEVQTLSTLLNGAFFKGNQNIEAVAIQNLFKLFPKKI